MALTPEESRRYARHIVLKGIGSAGQQKLKAAKVLVVGAGGLGSPVIAYLAGAGVGTIGICDDDAVSLSNLQRQILHTTGGIGRNKAESAAEFARSLNPDIALNPHPVRIEDANAAKLFEGYDLVVDGTDSFAARKVIAAACEWAGLPLVSGAVSMFDGQVTVFAPHLGGNPRFSDLYPDDPPEGALPACEEVGVLGPITGVIGTLMAMEVIKLITGTGEPLIGRLLLYDGRAARFTEMRYTRRPG